MIFGPAGEQFPKQGQPNWTPAQFLQTLSKFAQGNQQALLWLQENWSALTNSSQFCHPRPVIDRGHRYEYLPASSSARSDLANVGFPGTARSSAARRPAGLALLADNESGDNPTMPMAPSSWDDTV
jgi:hypothetical protein